MSIGQFKLDHLVEKNNECIIYRGSCLEENYIIILMNRQPLLRVEQYNKHFQQELNLIFKYSQKPKVIPKDFPFQIVEQNCFDSELIQFPQIIEIHETEKHYFFIINNCLQGQLINQQVNDPKTLLQIYSIYDCYFQAFKERQINDRDFNILRLFRSDEKLTLIDFGFASLQKQLPKKSWVIKLGELYNNLVKNELKYKSKNLINTLLTGKLRWEQVRQLLEQQFGFENIPEKNIDLELSLKPIRTNSIYSKQYSLSMAPEEIEVNMEDSIIVKKSKTSTNEKIKTINQQSIFQSKIISYGNAKQKEHFQKIRQSLSPGFSGTSRFPCRLVPVDQFSQQGSPAIRSVSRKQQTYQQFTQKQPITKPMENQYQYKNQELNFEDSPKQNLIKNEENNSKQFDNDNQKYKRAVSITTNQSQFESVQYTPTVYQRGHSLNNDKPESRSDAYSNTIQRPTTSKPRDYRQEQKEEKQEMKTLLRKSTRELQQPDQIKKQINQIITASRTINYSDKDEQSETFELKQIRRPQSRKNSIRKASISSSIENIELGQDSSNQQDKQNQQMQKQQFKTPRDQKQYSFQQSPVDQIKKNQLPIVQTSQQQNQIERQITFNQKVQTSQNNEYLPSFCQQEYQQIMKEVDQEKQVIQQQPKIKKQHSARLPPKSSRKNSLDHHTQDSEDEHNIIETNQNIQRQNNINQIEDNKIENLQLKRPADIYNIQTIQRVDVSETVLQPQKQYQDDKVDEKQLKKIEETYSNQIKKYDIIGKMVGGNVKYFQALKNFWIIPLFLCFKRMANFRKVFAESLANNLNLFDFDMKLVEKVEGLKILYKKLEKDNNIVFQELNSLFSQSEKFAKMFEPKELAKIQPYLNLDFNQDIKDIYFIYLYTQIFKTLQTQCTKLQEQQKIKENLILQAGSIISIIISEMPFNNDNKIFNLEEYNNLIDNYNQEQIQKYIKDKENIVQQLKVRLNQKGVKI